MNRVDDFLSKYRELLDELKSFTEEEVQELTRLTRPDPGVREIQKEDDYWDRLRMAYRNTSPNLSNSERWRVAYERTK